MLQMQRIYKLVEERELRQAEAVALRSAYNREQRQQNLDAILRAEHRETVKAPLPPRTLTAEDEQWLEEKRVRSAESKARSVAKAAVKAAVKAAALEVARERREVRTAEGALAWSAASERRKLREERRQAEEATPRVEPSKEETAQALRAYMSNATLSKDEG